MVPEIMDIYTSLSHLVQCPKPQKYWCIYIYICTRTRLLKMWPPHQYSNTNRLKSIPASRCSKAQKVCASNSCSHYVSPSRAPFPLAEMGGTLQLCAAQDEGNWEEQMTAQAPKLLCSINSFTPHDEGLREFSFHTTSGWKGLLKRNKNHNVLSVL